MQKRFTRAATKSRSRNRIFKSKNDFPSYVKVGSYQDSTRKTKPSYRFRRRIRNAPSKIAFQKPCSKKQNGATKIWQRRLLGNLDYEVHKLVFEGPLRPVQHTRGRHQEKARTWLIWVYASGVRRRLTNDIDQQWRRWFSNRRRQATSADTSLQESAVLCLRPEKAFAVRVKSSGHQKTSDAALCGVRDESTPDYCGFWSSVSKLLLTNEACYWHSPVLLTHPDVLNVLRCFQRCRHNKPNHLRFLSPCTVNWSSRRSQRGRGLVLRSTNIQDPSLPNLQNSKTAVIFALLVLQYLRFRVWSSLHCS